MQMIAVPSTIFRTISECVYEALRTLQDAIRSAVLFRTRLRKRTIINMSPDAFVPAFKTAALINRCRSHMKVRSADTRLAFTVILTNDV